MIGIKDLLAKFDHLLLSEETKKESIRNIISQIIRVKINSEDIKIKNGTLYLNIKPIYKNEILFKRDKINSLLKEALGKKAPTNIR